MLTGWTILPKPSFIYQRLRWWISIEVFDLCMFHNYHSSTKDLGGRGKSHNLFNASPSTASLKNENSTTRKANPTTCSMQVKQLHLPIPQLQISTCSTTIILCLSTKDLRGRGRSEEKGLHYVKSKQKLTRKLILVGSFLMCWLAGPFCRNFLLSTKDLNDET